MSSMDGSTGCEQRTRPRDTRRATLAAAMLVACLLIGGTASAQHVDGAATQQSLAALEHGLRPVVLKAGEPLPAWSLRERMAHYHVPGVAIAILKNGEVVHAAGYGVREAGTHDAVDADTLFSVGSISKVAAAATSLRLVSQGRIDLDRDVNAYLKSWRIPSAPDIGNPVVTMRMLMSHTAGLNVHGFPDFQPGERLPTLIETLDGKSPAKNDAVRLKHEPGWVSDYSGGGVMVEQQVIEDVTGLPLEAVARTLVFDPIGMPRSTFENPLPATRGNIAKAHDEQGRPTALPRGWETFPELAACGLWTSANELGAFVGALIKSYQGKGDFLPRAIATEMMTEVSPSPHGLGPRVEGAGTTRIFHHGGANDSYHAWIEGYLETGDGFVILTNGAQGYDLHREIRNALSDALGHGVNPAVRSVALGTTAPADYAGSYRIDAAVPMDVRRALADTFDYDSFELKIVDGAVALGVPGESKPVPLLPLGPTQFANPSGSRQFEVHRDARGIVRGLSVAQGASRAYYRRQASASTAAK
ncbi:MAG TPA: serine hydrolase domain-containing protein [Lysobacter sp.]